MKEDLRGHFGPEILVTTHRHRQLRQQLSDHEPLQSATLSASAHLIQLVQHHTQYPSTSQNQEKIRKIQNTKTSHSSLSSPRDDSCIESSQFANDLFDRQSPNRDLVKLYYQVWGQQAHRPYHGIRPDNPKPYKGVERKVRPVPGIISEDAKTIRRIPEDPLLTLPSLTNQPPTFQYTSKLSEERMAKLDFDKEGFLQPEERKLLLHVLAINEDAIAFTEDERGSFRQDYFSDYIIPVLPHIPWVERPLPIPPGLKDDLINYLKAKIKAGLYERAHSFYSSRWFCVLKKGGKLRIVHDLQHLNSITIRDADRPPEPDDFVSQCAGSSIYTVFDLFSGYDARRLHEKSRDLCAFNTPLGTYRPTGLPQGSTNAVQEFQACMTFILAPEMPNIASPFIDDIPVCGPKTRYEEEGQQEALPENLGIRRFVWEHANDINRVLHRIKCSDSIGS